MNIRVAVVGATGAVGIELLKIMEERNFPVSSLLLLASSKSAGKKLLFRGTEYGVEELSENSFKEIDLVLSSAGGKISKQFMPAAVKAGAVVVDNTSAFRMEKEVPLVIPEINPEDIQQHHGIIANPNCSTIIMAVPIFPLHQKFRIKRVVVSTYQAVSGAGAKAIAELESQTRQVLDQRPLEKNVFPHQIAFNLFSHNSALNGNGYCEEEVKMINETRKIFHDEEIQVSPTTIRVPVFRAHSESINLEFERAVPEQKARELLRKAAGVRIVDDAVKNYFPMPIEASHRDEVLVGRIRQDLSLPKQRGLNLWVSGDQIRKGAALNAVQIAEILFKTKN